MATMRMVEVATDKVVHVVAVWHGLMPAAGAVLVPGVMTRASVSGRALRGVGRADLDHMLVDMIAVRLMQVTVVQVVHVIAVLDRDMTAASAVYMRMAFMNSVFVRH